MNIYVKVGHKISAIEAQSKKLSDEAVKLPPGREGVNDTGRHQVQTVLRTNDLEISNGTNQPLVQLGRDF